MTWRRRRQNARLRITPALVAARAGVHRRQCGGAPSSRLVPLVGLDATADLASGLACELALACDETKAFGIIQTVGSSRVLDAAGLSCASHRGRFSGPSRRP